MLIKYYEGTTSKLLGQGSTPIAGGHELKDLQETTTEIRVEATDDLGNVACTTFNLHQKPSKLINVYTYLISSMSIL